MKEILIINGHPDPESFNHAMATSYAKGATSGGHKVHVIHLHDLEFNPILGFGYRKRTDLEPDLLRVWELIKQSNHIVWTFPLWWGDRPALLKGFIDRLFLPGLAFNYREDSPFSEKLLRGKTSFILMTMDMPVWYFRLFHGSPGLKAMKNVTLKYVGFKVRQKLFGRMRYRSQDELRSYLQKIEKLGEKAF